MSALYEVTCYNLHEDKSEKILVRKCAGCGGLPLATFIPPHKHYFAPAPPFKGAGYIECLKCEYMIVNDTMAATVDEWNEHQEKAKEALQ